MKKLNLISLVTIFLLVISTKINARTSHADFENYKIEKSDKIYVDDKSHKVWTINYGTGKNPVTIIKCKTTKGINYIVQSKYFALCYSNNNKGFGARAAKGDWNVVPNSINNAVINTTQMKYQQIITPNIVNDDKALKLIASYLPLLINDNYQQVLN